MCACLSGSKWDFSSFLPMEVSPLASVCPRETLWRGFSKEKLIAYEQPCLGCKPSKFYLILSRLVVFFSASSVRIHRNKWVSAIYNRGEGANVHHCGWHFSMSQRKMSFQGSLGYEGAFNLACNLLDKDWLGQTHHPPPQIFLYRFCILLAMVSWIFL